MASSIACSFASLMGRPPAAARTAVAHCGFIAMGSYLPVLWFVVGAVAVLAVAGLGAAGNWRGALRFMRTWFVQVMALVAAGLLLAAVVRALT